MSYDKTKPYSCPCCGYWNGDMKYDYYKHKKPLIKDKEIREAIRAWAKVVGINRWFVVSYNVQYHDCCIYCAGLIDTALIDIGKDLNVKEGTYTFAELCGEEEE